ncbi:MAG: hypothetical protein B6U89_06870 [Desulfurococcales archaeon ex4484_58]|nr:MAG: hypothetical protein B6U89_06870 [Desulfurococcales archaeon ex4484_58]
MNLPVIYKYILDVTAIILLLLIYTYILSGYGLIKSEISEYTAGLLNYRLSIILHLNPILRIALIISAMLHGITGFTLMCYRVRNKLYRRSLVIIVHLLFSSLTIYLLILEFT